MKQSFFLVITLVATLVLTACGGQESAEQTVVDMPTPIPTYTPQAVIDASQEGAPVPTPEAEATEKPSDEAASAGETTAAAAGQAEETPTAEATATEEPTAKATVTEETPTAAETPTAEATATEEPTAEAIATEEPTAEVTATEEPTAEVTVTEEPTAEVTATEEPKAEVTATEEPTAEATAIEEPTAEPTPTEAAAEAAAADPLAGLPAGVAAAMADADPGRGEQLTLQNGCTGCHSLDPDVTMVGPTWHNLAETAANRIEGQSAAEYLYHSITDPNAYVVEGFPPNVMLQNYADILSDQDLADLITYLLNAEQ